MYCFHRNKGDSLDENLIDFIQERKCLVFLVGTSGSGKTHSMKEIIDRVVDEKARVRIVELLDEKTEREHENGVLLKSDIIKAISKRRTKKTQFNSTSSRSILIVELDDIIFVDLLGTECYIDNESIFSNTTMLHLRIAIRKLANDEFVSFRECKLLQIIGKAMKMKQRRIIFIGCVKDNNDKDINSLFANLNLVSVKKLYKVEEMSKSERNEKERTMSDNEKKLIEINQELRVENGNLKIEIERLIDEMEILKTQMVKKKLNPVIPFDFSFRLQDRHNFLEARMTEQEKKYMLKLAREYSAHQWNPLGAKPIKDMINAINSYVQDRSDENKQVLDKCKSEFNRRLFDIDTHN